MVTITRLARLRFKLRDQGRKSHLAEEWIHLANSCVPGHACDERTRHQGTHCLRKPPEIHLCEHQVPPATAVLCREGFTPRIYWCNSQDYNKMSVRSTIQHVMVPMAVPPLQDGDPASTVNMLTNYLKSGKYYWWYAEDSPISSSQYGPGQRIKVWSDSCRSDI